MITPSDRSGALESVLLVDDDASGRIVLGISLRQAGYRVRSSGDGQEALKILRREAFNWLITDARMEPMNGFALSIAASKVQPELRIIMISGLCSAENMNGYPIERFFPKPIAVDQLLNSMHGLK
ncbi:MAG: response regulator [Elusimicrobia bacterium]|nr:response regulator [Elusimicrobiota bacterium]